MRKDDYILGGHHRWTHFWCGLIVGAGMGAWTSGYFVDSFWARAALTIVVALTMALSCARWGDAAWERLLNLFWWN